MTLTVRAVERVPLNDGEERPVVLLGAVRLATVPGEIFALVAWFTAAPRFRAIYWDRLERRFAFHELHSEVVEQLFSDQLGSQLVSMIAEQYGVSPNVGLAELGDLVDKRGLT